MQLVITDAGRAALVNAANTGTLPVTIAQIGVTATAFTANPDGTDTALPGEIKRLSTFAGEAVADDTIHVTMRDDTADVYSMRGIALYLGDGTLFGLYGQADVIGEKSAQAMLLVSADVKFTSIAATSLTFGDASFMNPPATTTVQGVTQYATNAEALTGTAGNRSIVASALKYVLDSRFGTGAPSAFVKGLLNLATAALFRTALEIKSAALKDEGAGNDLDADKLDGQHGSYYQAWANLTGVPANVTAWAGIAPTSKANSADAWVRGSSGPLVSAYSGDLDAAAGFHAVQATGANRPADAAASHFVIGWGGADYAQQIAARNSRFHVRSQENGTWGNWLQLLHSGMFDPNDVMLKSVSQTVTGSKTFAGALQSDHTGGVGLVINRSNAVSNSHIEYRTADGSLFAGAGNGAMWAIGIAVNLVDGNNRLFHVTATNAYVQNNAVWHAGNFTPSSKADTGHAHSTLQCGPFLTGNNYNGTAATTWGVDATTAATPDKVVARNSAGDAYARLWRSTYGDLATMDGAIAYRINSDTDNYIRFCNSPAAVRGWLGAAALAGDAFTGNISAPAVIATGANFIGSGTAAVLAPNGSGTVYLRPAGHTTSTAQTTIGSSGNMSVSGSVTATGGFQGSDERLKIIEGANPYGLRDVLEIETVVGRYRDFYTPDDSRRLFVVAQQLAPIIPEAVKVGGVLVGEEVDQDGNVTKAGELYDTVEYTALVPVLIRAVQELAAQVRELQAAR